MSFAEFGVLFGLGVVSSAHCLGMCGPIVLAYSVPLGGPRLGAHAAYNAGRILTYMLLGAMAGAVGRAIGMLGELAGLASGARIVAGAAMILAGVLMVLAKWPVTKLPAPLVRIQVGGLVGGRQTRQKFWLGLMLGFLPCGLVYGALLKALESAGAVAGALTMMAFGLGTATALLSVGLFSSFAGARLGQWANRTAAFAMVLFGAILLWRGILSKPVCHG